MNNIFIGNTDSSWFDFLARMPTLDEINFWQPSGKTRFQALKLGELFLFRLKSPINMIAGGGTFEWSDVLPLSVAWQIFEYGNGVASLDELRQAIERYRGSSIISPHLAEIGCIILRDAFFFEPHDWIPVPFDFPLNAVKGKTFTVSSVSGAHLLNAVEERLSQVTILPTLRERKPRFEVSGGFGESLTKHRLGQGAFRGMVLETYERRCAVTAGKVLPVLQAAHIRPVTQGGQHHITNGILMRSDVHQLFDLGYLTITRNHVIRASRRLQDDFNNGEDYRRFDGRLIWVPPEPSRQPRRELLEWHCDVVFQG